MYLSGRLAHERIHGSARSRLSGALRTGSVLAPVRSSRLLPLVRAIANRKHTSRVTLNRETGGDGTKLAVHPMEVWKIHIRFCLLLLRFIMLY